MLSDKFSLSMIDIIFALSQLEINDIDGIYLAYGFVWTSISNVFCNCLRYPIEHPMKISMLSTVLYFDDT